MRPSSWRAMCPACGRTSSTGSSICPCAFEVRRFREPVDPLSLPQTEWGVIARVSSVDIERPEGAFGPLVLTGRGEDARDGGVVATAEMRVLIDYVRGREIVELSITPDDSDAGAPLIGLPANARLRDSLRDRS